MKKAAKTVTSVSKAVVDAACLASFQLGMADAFLVAGVSLILLSVWVRSWIKATGVKAEHHWKK